MVRLPPSSLTRQCGALGGSGQGFGRCQVLVRPQIEADGRANSKYRAGRLANAKGHSQQRDPGFELLSGTRSGLKMNPGRPPEP